MLSDRKLDKLVEKNKKMLEKRKAEIHEEMRNLTSEDIVFDNDYMVEESELFVRALEALKENIDGNVSK